MKKLKRKSGFTLVECIVAMAVLVIMTLLLSMVLTITLNMRTRNMSLEREMDDQVQNLVQKVGVAVDGQPDPIVFEQGADAIEVIPKDGDDGMSAEKVYFDDVEAEIAAVEYDFDTFNDFEQISKGLVKKYTPDGDIYGTVTWKKGGGDGGSASIGGDAKAYGGVDSAQVTIAQTSCTDTPDGGKKVTLDVSFNVASVRTPGAIINECALKVDLPTTAKSLTCTVIQNCKAIPIASNVARIEPNGTGNVEAQITFEISSDEYDNDYKSVSNFYTGSGSGSSVTLTKDTDPESDTYCGFI